MTPYTPIAPIHWRASHYRTLLVAFEAVARGGVIHAPRTCGAYHASRMDTGVVEGHHLQERLLDLATAKLLSVTGTYPEFTVALTPLGLWMGQQIGLKKHLEGVRWDELRHAAPVALLPEYAGLNACYVEEDLLSSGVWVILSAGRDADGRPIFGILHGLEVGTEPIEGKTRFPSIEAATSALRTRFSSTGSQGR